MVVPSLALVEPRGSPRKELVPGLHSPRDGTAHRQLCWGWGELISSEYLPPVHSLHLPQSTDTHVRAHTQSTAHTHTQPTAHTHPAHSPGGPRVPVLSITELRSHSQT